MLQSTCFRTNIDVCNCARVCACDRVCVCVEMKKRVPDEWQALLAKIAIAMKRIVQNRKRPISSVVLLSS